MEEEMNITRPSRTVFYVSLVLAIMAFLTSAGILRIGIDAFILLAVAYIVLFLGVALKNF
jgi:hypothetical protein